MKISTSRLSVCALGLCLLVAASCRVFGQTAAPSAATTAAAPASPSAPAPASPEEAGHTLGVGLGQQLRQYGVTTEVPFDKIVEGVKDGLAGKQVDMGDRQRLQAYLRSLVEAAAIKNAADAKAFLEHNAKAKGVTTTASGLQYKILDAGDAKAASPQPTDQVTVRYRGTLLDGTEFDSSFKRSAPTTLTVRSLITGWQEALVMMKPGARWQLFIPPELAYGEAPRPKIPGNSLLIFELELQSIQALTH